MADHQAVPGAPIEIRSKPTGRPDGYYTACTCGWTSPERPRQIDTIRDLFEHCKEPTP